MRANAQTTKEVDATIKNLADAYKKRSLAELMECFAPDPDVVLFGTGADEKRIGHEQIRNQVERDWDQTESVAMSFTSSSISAAGTVAWAALDGAFQIRAGGQNVTLPARASFVLENRNGKWLIVHCHFSTPAAGQDEGRSF